jgi:PAS domain S-box-containing protein
MHQSPPAGWSAGFRSTLGQKWNSLRGRVSSTDAPLHGDERQHLRASAFALASVAVALVMKWLLGFPASGAPFLFLHAAIAATASYGGFTAAAVATLTSLLVARLTADMSLWEGVAFSLEGLLIAAVVIQILAKVRAERQSLVAAANRIQALEAIEHQGRLVESAFARLEALSGDTVILILDKNGRIREWGAGAARLYGRSGTDMTGKSAAVLFGPGMTESDWVALLADAARSAGSPRNRRQHRHDGTAFDANVEIRLLSGERNDGFTMVVRDRTPEQRLDVTKQEADTAHAQLAALQSVADPFLNTLGGADPVTMLLDRLCKAIGADGVALVHFGRFRSTVFCASSGVQCENGIGLPRADLRAQPFSRTLLVHNDAARVAEMSAGRWPEGISSLITVPVVKAGTTQAVVEVANARGRRATEWELALIQVVAARIAGLARDEISSSDAGAVA